MTLVPPPDLPPSPEPPSPAPPGVGEIHCQFCKCLLTPRGHALELSAEARTYRDQKELITGLRQTIADLENAVATITKERDDHARDANALRAEIAKPKGSGVRW